MENRGFRLQPGQAERYQAYGFSLLDGLFPQKKTSSLSASIIHKLEYISNQYTVGDVISSVERSREIEKIMSSHYFIILMQTLTKYGLLFANAELAIFNSSISVGNKWSLSPLQYSNQFPLDKGCTLWLPLTSDHDKAWLSASFLPKNLGYGEAFFKHLDNIIKLYSNAPSNRASRKNKHLMLWDDLLKSLEMDNFINQYCHSFIVPPGSAFLCDKEVLLKFSCYSFDSKSQHVLLGLNFYADDSFFFHDSGYKSIGFKSSTESNAQSYHGRPICELPIFREEPFREISLGIYKGRSIEKFFSPNTDMD